eukprot:2550472-Amphidinium_carterae.1
MDRARRRTEKPPSTPLLEASGTKSVPTLPFKWATLTLFTTARTEERRDSCLPSHALEAPACVRLNGLLPAPLPGALPAHEPALVMKAGVHTVWTDGSGRHSSNPHFRRCGVGYVTDTGEDPGESPSGHSKWPQAAQGQASSIGLKPTKPDKLLTKAGSLERTSKATRKPMKWPTQELLLMLNMSLLLIGLSSEIDLKPGPECDFLLQLKLRLRYPPCVEGPHRRVVTFNTFA